MEGKVIWFSNSRGYGFIGSEGGIDVFVHYSGIIASGYRTLKMGDHVTFQIVQGPKGPQAADVVVLPPGENRGAQKSLRPRRLS
jgi:cold shock protein